MARNSNADLHRKTQIKSGEGEVVVHFEPVINRNYRSAATLLTRWTSIAEYPKSHLTT